ncbi:MAG: tRNA (adenosine(37)-N6)-threonylcarbamoyltransferase complex dimerization subunit type 1 TsaB [Candidatus Neomarinimicrobiota bacterium]
MNCEPKLILGIETATINCSVGLVRGEKIIGQQSVTDRAIHSEKLIELIDSLLKPRLTLLEIAAIAVSIGPGSYTGLRIGLATAKGLVFNGNKPLLPVPTLTVLEAVARSETDKKAVFFIKSHRDLIYYTVAHENEPLVLKRPVAHDRIETVARLFPQHQLIGNDAFDDQFGERLKVCYPTGEITALIAARFYSELLALSRPDLEPDYYSNLEAKTWPRC